MKDGRNFSRILLAAIAIYTITSFQGCGGKKSDGEAVNIRFNQDFNYEMYDGRQVVARGYMATISPMGGKFIYLMNIPYQSCPFCVPNTTTIVNTIAVYAKAETPFVFYDGPIEIKGTLKVGDTVDDFGYSYPFKIDNASYSKLDASKLSENLKIYGALTQDGIVSDILSIVSQVDFNAFFEMCNGTSADINIVSDEMFDDVIRRINAISKTDYADVITILQDLKEYNQTVNANIGAKEYDKNCTKDMEDEIIRLFNAFFGWMNKFEI